jgi:hypothetical protein
MTLCVGLVEDGRCIIGADSQVTDEQAWTTAEPKVWEWGGVLFADAGPCRPSQVLRRGLDLPEAEGRELLYAMPDAIRKALKGVYRKGERAEHEIIVGHNGCLAVIHAADWSIHWPRYSAVIGHGPAVAAARGSLHTSEGLLGLDAEARLTMALEAGALVSPYVAGPWCFVRESA